MSPNHENADLVRTGFTAQQFVLIVATFLLGMASATVFNDLIVERSFGTASVVAAQVSKESK